MNDKAQKVIGCKVTYRFGGKAGMVQTSFKPVATLLVKGSQVVTTPPEAGASSSS